MKEKGDDEMMEATLPGNQIQSTAAMFHDRNLD